MQRLARIVMTLGATLLAACIVTDRHFHVWYDHPPVIYSASASCTHSPLAGSDTWTIRASVDDLDGPYDVVAVTADLYDEVIGGQWIAAFDLAPTSDPYTWVTSVATLRTVTCGAGYTVDVHAYDAAGAVDTITLDVVPR